MTSERTRLPTTKKDLLALCQRNPAFRAALYTKRMTPGEGPRIYRLAMMREEAEGLASVWRHERYLREFTRSIRELLRAMGQHGESRL